MRNRILLFALLIYSTFSCTPKKPESRVGLYRTFEQSLENTTPYSNKFTGVELKCTFIAPSGKKTKFIGFFDGDGAGGGDKKNGSIWKFRFIPDEIGAWHYQWKWSDSTPGGEDRFICDTTNAGKGILRAYSKNPRWLAYNGTEPVWLKSYYESGHGSIAQPFDWITTNVYQPMIDRGYNHLMVNWLLSLCCFTQIYHDGPAPATQDLTLYEDGKASETMRLNVWQLMEQHVSWLNDRNVGLHLFLGFDGSKNDGPEWSNLSEEEKDFLVRYTVARLAPYANIAGWGFVWEVPGDREYSELGWARLIQKYDVFDHLRTYEDEHPVENEYNRPEYNFAAIENHSIFSDDRDADRPYWKDAWTHHQACLAGYVPGKPVYMIEGNALWRRFWQQRTKATRDDLRQSAWACVTAGASFNWCGHAGEDSLVAFGPEGLPFFGDDNPYAASARQIDLLSEVMNREVQFYTMNPADSLLADCDEKHVWCLAEPAQQYLVFSTTGDSFKLRLNQGNYTDNTWMNTITGEKQNIAPITLKKDKLVSFSPPDQQSDWLLLVRRKQNE
ncbi:DUF5060 domain-containing protein [Mangrovibacterium lignilyticum]|uniref:DUF5060 domain-containing protein n=1 Tax=Mangrovibacterium lignilyticum TaxID=2668052 RepID=UPI0013CFFBEA|nr:DUF5060 domain-containing protein [Mangrovibacterium lignilyticum]